MDFKKLVKLNRSYRRFDGAKKIEPGLLYDILETARFIPSAMNMQQLRYFVSAEEKSNEIIFETLKWAGYLEDWDGPGENERPAAYILLLTKNPGFRYMMCDAGIAAQTILLASNEKGIGGCMIGSINREKLYGQLGLPEEYDIMLAIALGYPVETVKLEDVKNNDIKYYRDINGVHYVPKRKLEDLVLNYSPLAEK